MFFKHLINLLKKHMTFVTKYLNHFFQPKNIPSNSTFKSIIQALFFIPAVIYFTLIISTHNEIFKNIFLFYSTNLLIKILQNNILSLSILQK